MKYVSEWKESKFNIVDGRLKASKNVDKASWLMAQLIADKYTTIIPQYVSGCLLDLGCGNVPLYGFYKSFISDNICVDWDNSLHMNKHLDVRMDINEKLPFEDNSFETVICSDVLEHLFCPQNALKEMIRVCKKDGYIVFNVPFAYCMHECPFDYFRMTSFFYKRFIEECDNAEIELIQSIGGRVAVLVDKYAKIASSHKWMMGNAIQRFYYKFLKEKDISSIDSLGFIVVVKKTV